MIETETLDEAWHRYFYEQGRWGRVRWRGLRLVKHPMDITIFTDLIEEVRPRVIVETGSYSGGSALFFADMMVAHGIPNGTVVSVDIGDAPDRPIDGRISFVKGDSVGLDTLDEVHRLAISKTPRMVFLDSNHSCAHVLKELDAYAYLVTAGSYLVVEDSNIAGHPVECEDFMPPGDGGPWEALRRWLPDHPEFVPDLECERFGITSNPGGWLRRT